MIATLRFDMSDPDVSGRFPVADNERKQVNAELGTTQR